MPEEFLIFGHRGSPRRFPENTIASFEEAYRAGADGFETDLRMLSDQTAVLFHDDDLQDVEIETLTYPQCDERGAVVERLSALERFANRGTMVLEVKRSKWEEALIDTIRDWPNVVVASFDHSILAELQRREVTFALGLTTFGYILDVASYAARLGVTWCFPNHHYVDEPMVASLHERGIKVVPWTANRVREWQRLREIGCDGVITDVPEEAVRWREGA